MKEMQIIKIEGLASIISSIKNELQIAHSEALNTSMDPKFLLTHMSIDISLVLEEKNDKSGNFDLKIVSLGGSEAISDKAVQRVKLDFEIMENFDNGDDEEVRVKTFYNR